MSPIAEYHSWISSGAISTTPTNTLIKQLLRFPQRAEIPLLSLPPPSKNTHLLIMTFRIQMGDNTGTILKYKAEE